VILQLVPPQALDQALRSTSATGLVPRDRFDLIIHALAQLPDEVRLELGVGTRERGRLELLASAYGIEERVTFQSGTNGMQGVDSPVDATTSVAELVDALSGTNDPPAARRHNDALFDGHRIGVVTNVPAPYRIPLFNCIARRLEATGAHFRVFFLGTRSRRRPWMTPSDDLAFEYEVVRSFELPLGERRRLVPIDFERRLSAFSPSLVLTAGFSPLVSGRVAFWARHRRTAVGIWSGETRSKPVAERAARRLQRAWLLRQADFAIAYGFQAGEYLRHLDSRLPLVYGRNASPVGPAVRHRPQRPDVIELLTVADLASPRKGVDVLIDALRLDPDLPCRLTVVGGGALLPALQERTRGDERVVFLGPLPPERTRACYRDADVFLFPSRHDIFGLVLVEAMGSGLATVASRSPGAVADLALDGKNCLLVDGDHPDAWADAIRRLVLDHELRLALGESAKRTIRSRWTIEHACDAMIAGFRLGLLSRAAG
jgi:glycosyltransferase involved in cell wall biosynthesis